MAAIDERYLIVDTHTGTCYEFDYKKLEDAIERAKSLCSNLNIRKLEIVRVVASVMPRYDFKVDVSEKEG